MKYSIVDQTVVQILSAIWRQTRWKLPAVVVYASRVLVGRNKLCFWEHLPKWRDEAVNKRIAKVRKLGLIDGIVYQTKESARSWESAIKENLGLDALHVL